MTSEMMKSSIPSSWGSTREDRFAGGGPWCSWSAWAIEAASMALLTRRPRRLGGLDVLDGLVRGAAHALDEVGAQPARARRGQGRDDDVVDAEELQRVHDRRVRIGVADHARADQVGGAGAVDHLRQAGPGAARGDPVAALLGHDEDEEVALGRRARLELLEERGGGGGAVGDGEGDAEGQALLVEVDDDVVDRAPGGLGDALDEVAPQPARGGRRVRRDEDLVGLVLGDRVHRGGVGVGVADLADGVDALLAQDLAREVDAHLRGVEDGVVEDDVAVARVGARDADDDARRLLAGGLLLDAVQQRSRRRASRWRRRGWSSALASYSAVVVACVPAGAGTSAPLKIPCTAPGTPYS